MLLEKTLLNFHQNISSGQQAKRSFFYLDLVIFQPSTKPLLQISKPSDSTSSFFNFPFDSDLHEYFYCIYIHLKKYAYIFHIAGTIKTKQLFFHLSFIPGIQEPSENMNSIHCYIMRMGGPSGCDRCSGTIHVWKLSSRYTKSLRALLTVS